MSGEAFDNTLSVEQFANALGKGRRAVLAMIDGGEIVAEDRRSPGSSRAKYRIPRSEINRWRQARRTRGNASVEIRTPAAVRLVNEIFV